jgi:hypothetical protein
MNIGCPFTIINKYKIIISQQHEKGKDEFYGVGYLYILLSNVTKVSFPDI